MASAPAISAVLVRPLVAALQPAPKALEEFFRTTALTPALLADKEARVTPAQFCVAWAEALRLSGRQDLALDLAAVMPPGAFGVVEYVCRACSTLGEALGQWVRFLNLIDDAVQVALEGAKLKVVVESEAPAGASHELCFAMVVRQARELTGKPVGVEQLRFTHRVAPELEARYREWFGGPVTFGARETSLVFDKHALELPLTSADPNLLAVLLPVALDQQQKRPKDPPLLEQVRRALQGALGSADAQLETVARALSMTPRSLQRKLKDEGVAFAELREQTRRRLADQYLGQDLSIAEVSFLLGFSEPSAFFRAFKRWTGVTPQEHRSRASFPNILSADRHKRAIMSE